MRCGWRRLARHEALAAGIGAVLLAASCRPGRSWLRMALEWRGFQVHVACNGDEALRALAAVRPCAILLDLMMPIMDGLEFLEVRRQRPDIADVPVICVSAATPQMLADALRLGAQECLAKPTNLDELCERVHAYCVRSLP